MNNKFFDESGIFIPETIIKKKPSWFTMLLLALKQKKDVVLWEKESDFHSIRVTQNEIGRFLRYGISCQAGFVNSPSYKGNLPYLNYFTMPCVFKKNVKSILLIGLGTGIIVNQWEKLFDNIEKIDVVDIEENILMIAEKYFEFQKNDNFTFTLQDGRVFLKNNTQKYDMIAIDVAGNEGIDGRFFSDEHFEDIKKSLNDGGIFMFNSCGNTDMSEKNTFYGHTLDIFKKYFKYTATFNGVRSDILYYKSFYNFNKRILDITNIIFLASDKEFRDLNTEPLSREEIDKFAAVSVDVESFVKDLHKIYKSE